MFAWIYPFLTTISIGFQTFSIHSPSERHNIMKIIFLLKIEVPRSGSSEFVFYVLVSGEALLQEGADDRGPQRRNRAAERPAAGQDDAHHDQPWHERGFPEGAALAGGRRAGPQPQC